MNKQTLLLAFCCCATVVKSHDFTDSTGGTTVAGYDVSGSEIWHSYFLPSSILLAIKIDARQGKYKYINHPPYQVQQIPEHRLVCELAREGGNDPQNRCSDEFPHVHIDDFKMALSFARGMCASYGTGVVPEFIQPHTFVTSDKQPAHSHHYHYNLSQGLKFDCVALATY